MIAYIDLYRGQFGVELICRTPAATEGGFITSRGYRAAKTRPASDRQLRDVELLPVIAQVHAANYGVYGARKIWRVMLREGWKIGRDQVARLMRIAELEGVIRGRKPRTTTPAPCRSSGRILSNGASGRIVRTASGTPISPRSQRQQKPIAQDIATTHSQEYRGKFSGKTNTANLITYRPGMNRRIKDVFEETAPSRLHDYSHDSWAGTHVRTRKRFGSCHGQSCRASVD